MNGKLFTEDFLREGIRERPEWQNFGDSELEAFSTGITQVLTPLGSTPSLNEAQTIDAVIVPILELLGWQHYIREQALQGHHQTPDFLLFDSADAKAEASRIKGNSRYRHGKAILEAKKWQRPLDKTAPSETFDYSAPSTQILTYLSTVEVVSNDAVQWGILTNGRHWRLYWQKARSRAEDFLELDLYSLAGPGAQIELHSELEASDPEHFLKVFALLFGTQAHAPSASQPGLTLVQDCLDESRLWEEKVSKDLGDTVFDYVFPALVQAIADIHPDAPSADLEEVRQDALLLLYRMLFLLYAEDRNLLPPRDKDYDDYSLRHIREEIAGRTDEPDAFSDTATHFSGHLADLCRIVDQGDASIGMPPYNGGLFAADAGYALGSLRLSDQRFAPILDGLSRHESPGGRRWINYRDLSVQHLGAIYERLLEYDPVRGAAGEIELHRHPFARKGSGSYYTHDDLVQLIQRRAVGPLVDQIVQEFETAAARLAGDRRPIAKRLAELRSLDSASRILELKICDPAMGSGHFLVSLVDYLTDRALEQIGRAEAIVNWAPDEAPYQSPLLDRVAEIRNHILDQADRHSWSLDPTRLDDRHVVRRMVLKRVVYGVDKNPMAVELAKVSLWLHTFTVGAPLSFLDHHLRLGDSLFGEWTDDVRDHLHELGGLHLDRALVSLGMASKTFEEIAALTDADIHEAQQSARFFHQAEETLRPIDRLFSFWQALKWLPGKKKKGVPDHEGIRPLLQETFGELLAVVDRGEVRTDDPRKTWEAAAVNELLRETRALAEQERYLNWEVAFPTVWAIAHRSNVVSTRLSAIHPGTGSSCRRWSGSPSGARRLPKRVNRANASN